MKVLILFIVPKNSGLELAREAAKEFLGEKIEVRGEDIPAFVSKLIREGKKAIGITGEDLFKEFTLSNNNSGLEIINRIEWNSPEFIFKKPALCLLGPKNKKLEDLPKKLRVCINRKYKELAKKYCTNILENGGYQLEKIYASGATEEFFSKGIVDLVIDIVCSGKSAQDYDLEIYDKLFESDIVVIGKKDKKLSWKKMNNLIPTIIKDVQGNVLTLVYSTKESYEKTLKENKPYFFSRSRNRICFKGETSGNTQELIKVKTDCDEDALLFIVRQKGNACHLNRYSCFEEEKKFKLQDLYAKIIDRMNNPVDKSYTNKLVSNPNFLRRKIVEEAAEVITENVENREKMIEEFADLFYNILVYMAVNNITIDDIEAENLRRDKE